METSWLPREAALTACGAGSWAAGLRGEAWHHKRQAAGAERLSGKCGSEKRETKLTALRCFCSLLPQQEMGGQVGVKKQEDGGARADSHSLSECVEGRHVERQRLDCSPGPHKVPTRRQRHSEVPDVQTLGSRGFPQTMPPGALNSQRRHFPHTSPQGHLQGCGCHRWHTWDNQVLSLLSSRQGTKFPDFPAEPWLQPMKGASTSPHRCHRASLSSTEPSS